MEDMGGIDINTFVLMSKFCLEEAGAVKIAEEWPNVDGSSLTNLHFYQKEKLGYFIDTSVSASLWHFLIFSCGGIYKDT